MKKLALLLCAALTAAALTACGGTSQETTAAQTLTAQASETESQATDGSETEEGGQSGEEANSESQEKAADEPSADNPFNGKTVKVGCSATFVPYESIEMAADGSKSYTGMNIDIITAIVEKNGGTVEFMDMPFKSLMAAIQASQIDF